MEWSTNRRGCAVLVLIALLLLGIFLYFGWTSRDDTPSPAKGQLPPQQEQPAPLRPVQPRGASQGPAGRT